MPTQATDDSSLTAELRATLLLGHYRDGWHQAAGYKRSHVLLPALEQAWWKRGYEDHGEVDAAYLPPAASSAQAAEAVLGLLQGAPAVGVRGEVDAWISRAL
jgi:hypothetical protein